ncbi:MAG: T9SS type A sorting domain-containing protein, partial [Flavobacteriales bacterium]|nr:T9SS type A sorting domain-containing protein [Flavobacteriales bacterium]
TPDFATLNDAIDALTQRGACADVTFNVRPGSYTEQVVIGTFPDAGNHTVTIQSETQNASDVRFEYLPISSASNYVMAFTQTKNVILNHLTIANLSTTFSGVINFKGGNNNISIQYCNIYGDSLANTTTTNKMTIGSLNGIDDNIHIEYNVIIGGSYGIYMAGNDSVNVESGLVITHNKLRRYYGAGIGAFRQSALTVNHNNLKSHSSNTNTNIFHMSLENVVNGTEVNGNTVVGNQGGFGINLVRIKAPFNTNSLIASNSVYMGSTSSPTNNHGIAIQNCSNVNVVFNSVHTRAATSTAAGIRIYNGQSSGINLLYNNIVNTGTGYAVNSESAIYIDQADYNNYYTGTSNFVKEGSSYANLTALQSGTGKETHSFSVDPYFNGADLHTCRIELDNVASPINGVIYDADMNTRNTTTPDIGAYEFITANNFSLGSDIVKCPNDSVWIAAEQIQSASYYWSPFFQNTTGIYAIQAGTYIVQVIHSCGTSIDTVVVMNYPLPNAAFTYALNYFTGSFNNNSSQATHYYWDFGDGNTSTDTNPNHVFPTNGTYTVTLTAYSGCGDSSVTSQIIVINPNVAGLDNEEDILLQAYPNPSTGIFAVDLSPVESHEVNITIYDLTGRVVHQVTHDSTVEGLHTMIDISGQAAGTYIMKINAGNYQSTIRIIIK